jgi:hypothetical protein
MYFSARQGTGSYPPLQNGLHRKIRLIPKNTPFPAPYRRIASYMYSEQVGVKRQAGGKAPEMCFL